jgi:hypothetical protein
MASTWYEANRRELGRCGDYSTMCKCVLTLNIAYADSSQIELVATFCSLRLHKVPRVADIEHEV